MKRYLAILIVCVISILYCFQFDDSLDDFIEKLYYCDNIVVVKVDDNLLTFEDVNLQQVINELCLDNVSEFYMEDRLIIEGYTSKFNDYKLINGEKINVQISVCEDVCLMGYPLIKNSF